MPGGLLALVCYGNENILVNGNPQMTNFYKIFQKYTHFSQEPIRFSVDGPDQLKMDAPITLRAKVPRNADLLSDLCLRIAIPDVFSKAYVNNAQDLQRKYEFAWIKQLGPRMIQSVTCTIGGQLIQEFTGEWLATRAYLDLDSDTYYKWSSMVGNTADYFDPANGLYADPNLVGTANSYPNVVAWRGAPGQNNAPSIPGRILRIPLGLWFSDYIGNSLPLVALQYHEVELEIVMAPIRNLYTVLDPSGVRLRPGIRSLAYEPTDQYNTIYNPALYGTLPASLNNLYGQYTDLSGSMRYFLTDISGAIPAFDGWPLNATLEGLYTYVQLEEQRTFTSKTLRYNVRQAKNFVISGVNTRNVYRLDVHNISTRIVFYARRSDSLPYRNQPTNLTNWLNPIGAYRPYVVPSSGQPNSAYVNGTLIPLGRSGINLPGLSREIVRSAFITANGTALFESQDSKYFSEFVAYKNLKGDALPFYDYGLLAQVELSPVYTYSFALHGSEVEQPTGTLNISRIDRLDLDVDVTPIPVGANYTYELQIYVEVLNFLEISAGLGGIKFAT
jgi:hypothetical protein